MSKEQYWRWESKLDAECCSICNELNGRIWSDSELERLGGFAVRCENDECRCRLVEVKDDEGWPPPDIKEKHNVDAK